MADFLHERRDFDQLLAVVANERALDPMLVEKDYWIMHSLWGIPLTLGHSFPVQVLLE